MEDVVDSGGGVEDYVDSDKRKKKLEKLKAVQLSCVLLILSLRQNVSVTVLP